MGISLVLVQAQSIDRSICDVRVWFSFSHSNIKTQSKVLARRSKRPPFATKLLNANVAGIGGREGLSEGRSKLHVDDRFTLGRQEDILAMGTFPMLRLIQLYRVVRNK